MKPRLVVGIRLTPVTARLDKETTAHPDVWSLFATITHVRPVVVAVQVELALLVLVDHQVELAERHLTEESD